MLLSGHNIGINTQTGSNRDKNQLRSKTAVSCWETSSRQHWKNTYVSGQICQFIPRKMSFIEVFHKVFSLNSLNSVLTKRYSNLLPLVEETHMLAQRQQDTDGKRKDLWIDPNSCFNNLSDSLKSPNYSSIWKKLQHITTVEFTFLIHLSSVPPF